jgi:hypothetical protein
MNSGDTCSNDEPQLSVSIVLPMRNVISSGEEVKIWKPKLRFAALMPTIISIAADVSAHDDTKRLHHNNNTSVSFFSNNLPMSLMCLTFSFLALNDHWSLACINKLWCMSSKRNESQPSNIYELNDSPLLYQWTRQLIRHRPTSILLHASKSSQDHLIECFVAMSATLTHLEVGMLSSISLSRLQFLTSLTLSSNTIPHRMDLSPLVRLSTIKLASYDVVDDIRPLISRLPVSITSFEIGRACDAEELDLLLTHLPQLTHLSMTVTDGRATEFIPLMVNMTHLDTVLNHIYSDELVHHRLPSLLRMTIGDVLSEDLHYYVDMAPNLTRIDDITLTSNEDCSYVKSLCQLKQLNHLALTIPLGHQLSNIHPLSHCLRSLTLACPSSVRINDFSSLQRLTRLRLLIDVDLIPWSDVHLPDWEDSFINHVELPCISFTHQLPVLVMPLIKSIQSTSSMGPHHGRLHIYRYESLLDDWMDAGLSPTSIVLHDPDDYDCVNRMKLLGVLCMFSKDHTPTVYYNY